jgi:Skp family chaperone for outer membrane proteins
MSRRQVGVETSLSFLDVIACAVGVILFITLLAITTSVRSFDPGLAKQIAELEKDSATVDRMLREAAQRREAAEKWQAYQEKIEPLQKHLAELKAALSETQERIRLSQEISAEEEMIQALRRQTAAFERVKTQLASRRPVLRETPKTEMAWFLFDQPGYVRIIERSLAYPYFRSSHYEISALSVLDDVVVCKPISAGYTVSEVLTQATLSSEFVTRFNRAEHYIACHVRPPCFEDFVRVREAMYRSGIEVGFVINEDPSDIVLFGSLGSKAPVQ